MLLNDCADISQGAILARIKEPSTSSVTELSVFMIKHMTDWFNFDVNDHANTKRQTTIVDTAMLDQLPIARRGMVILSLAAPHRAIAVDEEHEGKLVSSNFAVIQPFDDVLDPKYLAWALNEHPSIQQFMRTNVQGTILMALSIHSLRGLHIEPPSLSEQQMIGNLYHLVHRKSRLVSEKSRLEKVLVTHKLLEYTNRRNSNDNN